jgi:hypothetical protein
MELFSVSLSLAECRPRVLTTECAGRFGLLTCECLEKPARTAPMMPADFAATTHDHGAQYIIETSLGACNSIPLGAPCTRTSCDVTLDGTDARDKVQGCGNELRSVLGCECGAGDRRRASIFVLVVVIGRPRTEGAAAAAVLRTRAPLPRAKVADEQRDNPVGHHLLDCCLGRGEVHEDICAEVLQ